MVGMLQLLTYAVCLGIIVCGIGVLNSGIISGKTVPAIFGAVAFLIASLGAFYLAKEQTVQAMLIGTTHNSLINP